VSPGQDPGLKRAAGSKRNKGAVSIALNNDSLCQAPLFFQQLAKGAGPLGKVSALRPLQLPADNNRHKGEGEQLGMRMFNRSTRFTAVIAEDLQVTQIRIIGQHPAAPVIGFNNELHLSRGKAAGVAVMFRDLDQYFVSSVTGDILRDLLHHS